MIRKITFLALLLSFTLNAQVAPTILNNLTDGNVYEGYSDMALYNNTMYISNSDAGAIIKVDISVPDATPALVLSNLSLPTGISVFGTDLYFFEGADGMLSANSGKLWKLDLTNPAATPVQLFSGLSFPTEIEVSGTNVYVVENFVIMGELDHGQLSLINLVGTPTKTVLYDQFYSLDDIEINGTDLYLLEWTESNDESAILKLNVATGTPGTPVLYYQDVEGYYPLRIEIQNNRLYFNMDSSLDPSVMSLDLASATPAATVVATPFEYNGQGVYLNEMIVTPANMLYTFASMQNSEGMFYFLYNADLSSLQVNESKLPEVTAYPNPCSDLITINGIETATPVSIFDLTGKQVVADVTAHTGAIDVSSLESGMYFIAIDGLKAIKFVKQ